MGQSFSLRFVRSRPSRNGAKGSIKTVERCHYGKKRSYRSSTDNARQKALHKDQGTLPLYDADTGNYLSPLISHIIYYNDLKVIH